MQNMKALTTHLTKWEVLPYDLRGGSALIGYILLCSLLGGCSSFSTATRNNEGTVYACVDRDLSNGDSCMLITEQKEPGESDPSLK